MLPKIDRTPQGPFTPLNLTRGATTFLEKPVPPSMDVTMIGQPRPWPRHGASSNSDTGNENDQHGQESSACRLDVGHLQGERGGGQQR